MSASNENTGFTIVKGPKSKVSTSEARRRYEESLTELETGISELSKMLSDLDVVLEEKTE